MKHSRTATASSSSASSLAQVTTPSGILSTAEALMIAVVVNKTIESAIAVATFGLVINENCSDDRRQNPKTASVSVRCAIQDLVMCAVLSDVGTSHMHKDKVWMCLLC